MNDLQEAFVDVIEHLDLPATDLVAGVLDSLESAEPSDAPGGELRPDADGRRLAPALAAALAVAVVALVAVATPVGQAVADWFGIGATAFEVDTDPDRRSPSTTESSSLGIDLGEQVVPTPSIVPIESLGPADAVFDDPRRGRTFVWGDGPGAPLRLSARSITTSTLAIKSLAAEEDVEFVTIVAPNEPFVDRPLPGVWIGAPHTLSYPVEGLDLELTVDAGPVLIWVDGDVELRLEGTAGQAEAMTLAAETVEGTELLPAG